MKKESRVDVDLEEAAVRYVRADRIAYIGALLDKMRFGTGSQYRAAKLQLEAYGVMSVQDGEHLLRALRSDKYYDLRK